MKHRVKTCHRVTEFVSLELDGELSRFERAILRRHLERCADCAEYASQVRHTTEVLRLAPLERPSRPIVVRRPRRAPPRLAPIAAALAAVAATTIWLGIPSSTGTRQQQLDLIPQTAAPAGTDGRSDWPAGLPRTIEIVELVPGGLYRTNVRS